MDAMIDTILKVALEPGCEEFLPSKAYPGDAAFDVYAADPVIVPPDGTPVTVSLGFRMELQEGFEAHIRPRSGLASKEGISVVFGTIDSGYRGVVKATLYSLFKRDLPVAFPRGARIAQMALSKVPVVMLMPIKEISPSLRGSRGHGSSGV